MGTPGPGVSTTTGALPGALTSARRGASPSLTTRAATTCAVARSTTSNPAATCQLAWLVPCGGVGTAALSVRLSVLDGSGRSSASARNVPVGPAKVHDVVATAAP